jgi:hypothetical protein
MKKTSMIEIDKNRRNSMKEAIKDTPTQTKLKG